MTWTPEAPDDFSRFTPADMPRFLEWWEVQHSEAIALQLTGAFVEGITQPWLALVNSPIPPWIETMLRWRLAAQWAYEQGVPLIGRMSRGLPGILGINYPEAFRITPADIAEIPPAVRAAFNQGNQFSLSWVKKLSNDARSLMGDLMSINTLKNRSFSDVVPILERVLRRDLVAEELGVDPDSVSPEQIEEWVKKARFSVLEAIARRAELISVTEGMRMMNLGILTSMEQQGEGLCYVMPHRGSCPECQRLIDGRVFRIQTLRENLFVNFGVKKQDWKPALPQHPACRHSPMGVSSRFRKALKILGIVPDEGVLLEWYGLPGGKRAFDELGLEQKPWLTTVGRIE